MKVVVMTPEEIERRKKKVKEKKNVAINVRLLLVYQ